MRRWAIVIALGAGLGALPGCGSPVPVRLETRPTPKLAADADVPVLTLLPARDARPTDNQTNGSGNPAGNLGAFVTSTDSLPAWIDQEARRQLSKKFRLQAAHDPAEAHVDRAVQLTVMQCYVHSVRGHPSVQIVLRTHEYVGGNLVREQVVRGQSVGSVWFSASAELGGGLRRALEDAIQQVVGGLDEAWAPPTAAQGP